MHVCHISQKILISSNSTSPPFVGFICFLTISPLHALFLSDYLYGTLRFPFQVILCILFQCYSLPLSISLPFCFLTFCIFLDWVPRFKILLKDIDVGKRSRIRQQYESKVTIGQTQKCGDSCIEDNLTCHYILCYC